MAEAVGSNQSKPFTYHLDQSPNTTTSLFRTSSTTSGPTDSLALPRQRMQQAAMSDTPQENETIADSAEEDNNQHFEIILSSPACDKSATKDAPAAAVPVKAARPPWKARPSSAAASTSAASLSCGTAVDANAGNLTFAPDLALSKSASSSAAGQAQSMPNTGNSNDPQQRVGPSKRKTTRKATEESQQSPPPRKKQRTNERLSQNALARNAKESDDDESFNPNKQIVDARWASKKKDSSAKSKAATKVKPVKGKGKVSSSMTSEIKTASPPNQVKEPSVGRSAVEHEPGIAVGRSQSKKRNAETSQVDAREGAQEGSDAEAMQALPPVATAPSPDPLGNTIAQSSASKRVRGTRQTRNISGAGKEAAASVTISEPDSVTRSTRSSSRSVRSRSAKETTASPVKKRRDTTSVELDLADESEIEITAKPAKKRPPPKSQNVAVPKDQQHSLQIVKVPVKSAGKSKKKRNVIEDSEEEFQPDEGTVELDAQCEAPQGCVISQVEAKASVQGDQIEEVASTKVKVGGPVPVSEEAQRMKATNLAAPERKSELAALKPEDNKPVKQPSDASKNLSKPKKKGGLAAILSKTGIAGHRNPGLSRRSAVTSLHQNIKPVVKKPPIPKSKKRADSDDDGEEFVDPVRKAREKKLRAELGLESDEEIPEEWRARLRAGNESD